jgi:LysM repeat protein
MNRRQLAFVILVNAAISLLIALGVVWLAEMRRPDPTELAAFVPANAAAVLAATPTEASLAVLPTPVQATPASIDSAAGDGNGGSPGDASGSSEVGEQVVHIVAVGESLGSIAAQYGINIDAIVQANSLANPDFVFSGQRLIIPASSAGSSTAVSNDATPVLGVEILDIEAAGDLTQEAVLIANESNSPFNLNGWQLSKGNGPSYTFGNVQLFPGSSIRLYSTAGTDNSIALYWGQTDGVWTPESVAELRNADALTIDTYEIAQQ